jgi:hypothetical protein
VRARLAWTLAAVTLVAVIADVVVTAEYHSLLSEAAIARHGFPFVELAVLGCSVLGAVVVNRYDRHPVGWLLSVIGTTSSLSLLAEAYALWVTSGDGPGPAALGGVSGWTASMLGGQLAIGGLALMFLLAPDGHFQSRRWRYAALVIALGELSYAAGLLTTDPTTFDIETQSETVGALQGVLFTVGFLLIAAGLLVSLVSMLLLLNRSHDEQRQQVSLIALSAGCVSVGLVALIVVQLFNGGEQTWVASLPLFVSYLLLPILFAVAVLKYRLFDLEVIINRTVVLAAGTAFAAIGYTSVVVSVGRFVDGRTSGFWVSLLSLALVAVAFQPLRRWVVAFANRLAFGSRAKPYQELAELSRQLGDTPTADTLLPTVAAAAGRALSARSATATLDVPGADASTATWGDTTSDGTDLHVVPVRDAGVLLGSVAVTLPRGRALLRSDERLLQALADQASVAYRNAAIEIQLAQHVAELDRTTRELDRSRSRIIEADDAVRRTLEASISREVLPFLVRVADELGCPSASTPSPAWVEGLVADVNAALESLRELTRGVFPTQLARSGLEPALRSALAATGPTSLVVDASAAGRRFDRRVEAAVYFCCAQTSRAVPPPTLVELYVDGESLVQRITGVTPEGLDLQGVTDRVNAVGGTFSLEADGLTLHLPIGARHPVAV